MLWCYCFQSHWIMLTWCQCYFFVKHFLLLWGNAVIVFKVPGMESNSRSWQADSDTLIMPEIGSYFQLARFAIFHSFSFCLRHFLALSNCWLCLYPAHWWAHFPLISATICPALKIYLETFSLSNYWLCIRLAHRWTHSIQLSYPKLVRFAI